MKSLVWMLIPNIVSWNHTSRAVSFMVFFCMAALFHQAVRNGWFQVRKQPLLLGFWITTICTPIIYAGISFLAGRIPKYQMERIYTLFHGNGFGERAVSLRLLLQSGGMGGNGAEFARQVYDYDGNYAISYFISNYGIIAGMLVCILLGVIVVKILKESRKQKNQLGKMLGAGCGMAFLMNFVVNVICNVIGRGITFSYFPFLSNGKFNLLLSYFLMGVVMSVYRYKNILPVHCGRKLSEKKISL